MHILVVSAHPADRVTQTLVEASVSVMRGLGHTVDHDDIIESGLSDILETLPRVSSLHRDDKNYLPDGSASRGDFVDPPIDGRIADERARVERADMLILHIPFAVVHPADAPAYGIPDIRIQHWLDTIIADSFSGNFGRIYANGGLRGRTAFIIVTTDDRIDAYPSEDIREEQAERMLHPILHSTLYYCGMDVLRAFIQYERDDLPPHEIEECVIELAECLCDIRDEDYIYRYDV